MTCHDGDFCVWRLDNDSRLTIVGGMFGMKQHLCIGFLVITVELKDLTTNDFPITHRQTKAFVFNCKIDVEVANSINVVILGPLVKEKRF